MKKNIHIIINPISGRSEPILFTINSVLSCSNYSYTVDVTQKNNTKELARKARNSGSEIIAVYGGDGTVTAVAEELIHSDKTLAVLPGGSANIFSLELGLPQNLKKACQLITSKQSKVRTMDVGRMNEECFLLRSAFGFEAQVVKDTLRTTKNQLGLLAYALSSFKAALKTRPTQYDLILDGEEKSVEGLSVVVANCGNLGLPKISIHPHIKIDDGLLDVILIRTADIKRLFAAVKTAKPKAMLDNLFLHRQVKSVSVTAHPAQAIHYDGEILKTKKTVNFSVESKALRVLVPKK